MMKQILLLLIILAMAGCTPEIGDACDVDYDCSQNMDRNCDPTQPAGYCLILGCNGDDCPEEAVCVEFTSPCPVLENGEEIDDCSLIEPNRKRQFCLRHCSSNSDCRTHYYCAEATDLEGEVIDLHTSKTKVCVPEHDEET